MAPYTSSSTKGSCCSISSISSDESDSETEMDLEQQPSQQNPSRSSSPTSLFEQSLFSLFSHNQPAHGDPGDTCIFSHPNLPVRKPGRRCTKLKYRISKNSGTNTKLFAHHQWDSGLYLAEMIACQSVGVATTASQSFLDVRQKSVVELGAGTGLPGLVATVMGAEKTVLTDYPDPLVLSNLRDNMNLAICSPNSHKPTTEIYRSARQRIQVVGLEWGSDQQEQQVLQAIPSSISSSSSCPTSGFDIVLAADVLWVSSAHPSLIHSIRRLLKRSPTSRCVLIAGFHTGLAAVTRFFIELGKFSEETKQQSIIPDWQEPKWGGIWLKGINGIERPWSGAWIPTYQQLVCPDSLQSNNQQQDDTPDDVTNRGNWVVVASLRWADLE